MAKKNNSTIREILEQHGIGEGDEKLIAALEKKFKPLESFADKFTIWTHDESGLGSPTFDDAMNAWAKLPQGK
jgi:hypothetical protein